MRKKLASISLIVTVNILLLTFLATAHHHHHQGLPHFSWSVHETTGDNACNADGEEELSCPIEQNYLAVKPAKENTVCPPCFPHNNHPDHYFQSLLPGFTCYLSLPDAHQPFRQPPYLITCHSTVARPGWGLRAPPEI
jgi:hypothetical protein